MSANDSVPNRSLGVKQICKINSGTFIMILYIFSEISFKEAHIIVSKSYILQNSRRIEDIKVDSVFISFRIDFVLDSDSDLNLFFRKIWNRT